MAWTQTKPIDTRTIGEGMIKDDDGFFYLSLPGGLRMYVGSGGDPDGVITAPLGSKCCNKTTGQWYTNDDGATSWEPDSTSVE